ncbi:MAG: MFS transporter [Deltaproteobacteria bacterium]|nr:MFS transporter [Deltaproteobacteria bacterium]
MDNTKPRFFYGYLVVAASFTIMVLTFGINYSFGVFFKPLVTEFGWARGLTSGAYSLMTVMAGFLGIFAGKISDRYGPRIIGVTSGALLGIGFLILSGIQSIGHFYLVHIFILSAGIGAVWPGLVPAIARWFTRRRGLMTGVMASGVGLGTLLVPPIASWIITLYGWRKAYLLIGISTFILALFSSLFLKRDPAQVNLLPYGEDHDAEGGSPVKVELPFGAAVRSGVFMLLCAIYFCYGYSLHTVMVHIVPHAIDMGTLPTSASRILGIIGLTSIGSRILIAGASDRMGVRPALLIVFSLLFISLLWVNWANTDLELYVFGFLFGTSYGGIMSLQALAVAEIFGLAAVGQILGAVVFHYTIGASIGPLVTGYVFDLYGSYSPAFWTAATFSGLSLLLTCYLKVHRSPER